MAPHLRRLDLEIIPRPSWDLIYQSCVNISNSTVRLEDGDLDRLASMFGQFPSNQIAHLKLLVSTFADNEAVIAAEFLMKFIDCASLGKLASLGFRSVSREKVLVQKGGRDSLNRWEARQVKFEFYE